MTPAKSAATATGEAAVPEQLLNEGEVVILALKPSIWFVVLNAWPAIVVATTVMALGYAFLPTVEPNVAPRLLVTLCLTAVLIQLLISCCQWTGRLYILTNVRVIRVRGVFRVDVFQCPLKKVQMAVLAAGRLERMVGVGSIMFQAEGNTAQEPGWLYISRPAEVNEMVQEALRRAHG